MRALSAQFTAMAVMAVIGLAEAPEGAAQTRPMGGFLQAGVVSGSGEFVGIGASATFEIAVYSHVRAFIQWGDWNALGSCIVTDAENTCSEEAESWEAGLRLGFGESPRVAPFAGVGVGVYDLRSSLYDASRAATVSAATGLDIMISAPAVLRLSASYQEVLGQSVRDRVGGSLRFMGLHAGLGLAVW